MSSKSTSAAKGSTQSAFRRRPTKAESRYLTSEVIADDIAAFKKRGGNIEVLGNTPYGPRLAPTTFHSDAKSKRKPTAPAGTKSAARG